MSVRSDKCKQSLYFSAEMLAEIRAEARRMDRSVSWVMQQVWKYGKEHVRAIPAPTLLEEVDTKL